MIDREIQLRNKTILIPKGGDWGVAVGKLVSENHGSPLIIPFITTATTSTPIKLNECLTLLQMGKYAWLVVTSGNSVKVLADAKVKIPSGTKIATVGSSTAKKISELGYCVDFMPQKEFSAKEMLNEWPVEKHNALKRILILHSQLSKSTLAQGLRTKNYQVDTVEAYRTEGVLLTKNQKIAAMKADVSLITSASIAFQVGYQLVIPPPAICIGPTSYSAAQAAGLQILRTATTQSIISMLTAYTDYLRN